MAKIQHFRFAYPICIFRKGRATHIGDVLVIGQATVLTLHASGISVPLVHITKLQVLPLRKQPRFLHAAGPMAHVDKGHSKSIRHAIEAHVCRRLAPAA